MSGHTPGPWSLTTVSTSCGSCHKIGPFPGAGHRKEVHACVYADGIRIGFDENLSIAKELLANARLMAAAPKLLAALQAIVKSLADHDDEGMIEHAEEMIEARAAIAAAVGETK